MHNPYKKKLIIFPYNGNAIEAYYCLNNSYHFVGFIDDDFNKKVNNKKHKIYSRKFLKENLDVELLAVPGSSKTFTQRENIIEGLISNHQKFATIIHPSAFVSSDTVIGNNVLIMAGVVITSNAIIEDHVIILPNTVVHHDVLIKKHTIIGSNVVIASRTIIDQNCYIGSGSNIIGDIVIGEKTLVGLGSNVIKSVNPNSKIAGNPAKSILK